MEWRKRTFPYDKNEYLICQRLGFKEISYFYEFLIGEDIIKTTMILLKP